jgi:hypothetical protein
VDHFVCSTKGRLFHTKGKELERDKFSGGCIFVDHASGYIHVEMQTHLNTHETLKAKEKFVKEVFLKHNPHFRYRCFVDEDDTELLGGEGSVQFGEPPAGVTEVEAGAVLVFDVPLPRAGAHAFEITIEGGGVTRVPLTAGRAQAIDAH